jgi:hypothetical protein
VKLPGLRRYRVADSEAEARLAEIEALGDVEPAAGGDG